MKVFNKQKKILFFSSDGCSIIKNKNYLVPFKKINFIENDFKIFKKINKNEKSFKSSYRNNFF